MKVKQASEIKFLSPNSHVTEPQIITTEDRDYHCYIRREKVAGNQVETLNTSIVYNNLKSQYDLNKIHQALEPASSQWKIFSKLRRDFMDDQRKQSVELDSKITTLDRQLSSCEKVTPERCNQYAIRKKLILDDLIANQFDSWKKRTLITPSFTLSFESKDSAIHKIECSRTDSYPLEIASNEKNNEQKILQQIKADRVEIVKKLGFEIQN